MEIREDEGEMSSPLTIYLNQPSKAFLLHPKNTKEEEEEAINMQSTNSKEKGN